MAEHGMSPRPRSGPANKQIATTFLESLAVRGQATAWERAMRALGWLEGGLAEAKAWLPDGVLGRMFAAADTDPSLARSVGHRLMAPDAAGFSLYGLGLATPEKAYRRVAALLPRDRATSFWIVGEIGSGSARIEYHDRSEDGRREIGAIEAHGDRPGRAGNLRAEAALCALRIGMLEAVPGLYGLLPARVTESTCRAKGADACRYEIVWARGSTAGLVMGSVAGLALAAGFGATAFLLGPAVFPISASVSCALTSFGLALVMGRSLDLHRQLEAVAGARRGHLALLDQVDAALASKLDALARADAKLEGDEFAIHADRSFADSGAARRRATPPGERGISAAVQKIHSAAGELECWFEDGAATAIDSRPDAVNEARGRVREIRAWAEGIAEKSDAEGSFSPDPVDLVALLRRAIAAARPTLPGSTMIEFEHDEDLLPIVCEPIQIEQVVVQLLRNAGEASRGLTTSPEIFVSLRSTTCGVELAVADRGVGIEPSLLDEVFDPFFGERRAGIDEGFSLPDCLRIVERHGGELRIEAGDRPGTRVSILWPKAFEPGSG